MNSKFDELYENVMKMAMLMTMKKMVDSLDSEKSKPSVSTAHMTKEEFLRLADSEQASVSKREKAVLSREEFLKMAESENFSTEMHSERPPYSNRGYTAYHERKEESPLRKLGYAVDKNSELSEVQRQGLLQNAIEHGIVSKGYVITYLESNIRINGSKESNSVAVYKWKRDLAFVKKLE